MNLVVGCAAQNPGTYQSCYKQNGCVDPQEIFTPSTQNKQGKNFVGTTLQNQPLDLSQYYDIPLTNQIDKTQFNHQQALYYHNSYYGEGS